MATNPQVLEWIQNTYPSPKIDPDWLAACLEWIETDLSIPMPPAGPLKPVIDAVNSQLLQSDLSDSMLHGTGLPLNLSELNDVHLTGTGVLVQITAITEIASSAFTILNVMKAREERGIVGLDEANVADEDDEGPIQRYPRGMLRFELSDGSTTLNAIEYRSLPALELGVTPLGYKMRVKNPLIRGGIAFLEPANVDLVGGSSEDREARQIRDLARGLGIRLGIYDPDEDQDENEVENNGDQPAAPPPERVAAPPGQVQQQRDATPARIPFRDLSPPPLPGPSARVYVDDEEAPRRRKVPAPAATASTIPASSSTLVESRYFASAGTSNGTAVSMRDLAAERILSPGRVDPIDIPDSPSPPPPPSTRKVRPIAQLPARSKGKQALVQAPSSDFDFDFGDDDVALVMDDASALQELEMIEGTHRASVPAVVPPSSSGSGSRSAGGNSRTSAPARAGLSAPTRSDDFDDAVIVIESDEEQGDKENVPVPTRHVRRRTQQRRGPVMLDEDVIDISSSE